MDKQLEKKYNHLEVEKDKYDLWIKNNLFKPATKGEPFCIILPPPNVTGILHLGHAWDAAIQDAIIRYKKIKGFRTLWVPGTDHAGIATQTKFETYLKNNNLLSRQDLGRSAFIKQLMTWKNEQVDFIHMQWKKLGLSLDYSREKFSMDKDINDAVNKTFADLYNNKLIYKGTKLVNWDVQLQTAISDIEVIYKPTIAKMYYFKYFLDNKKKKFIEVATTRPETMFGDVCVFVNPNDKRYKKLINKKVLNPVNMTWIPIIADKYVEIKFGSGAMKCTPAHDFNDYELANKHKLEKINIMNKDGTMNEKCGEFQSLDRLVCRNKLVDKLSIQGYVIKIIENYDTQIGYSERTGEIIEPYISNQWFMKMKPLAKKVIDNQKNKNNKNATIFLPKRFDKTLLTWLDKIEDWCISRQLWWGHQIPAWYHKETNQIYVNDKIPPTPANEWVQDEDVLDTWFSSSLWPLVCLGWPKSTSDFNNFFPTKILVTGYDIIFFWVSRMMMLSTYFTSKTPFENVYIHGLIRDKNGKKMSKSLNNGIEPISVIDEYGADTLRIFLTSSSTLGEDLNFSNERIKNNWNFLNKIWNSARFILSYIDTNVEYKLKLNRLPSVCLWILNKLSKLQRLFEKNMDDFNFVVANKLLYDFVWNDFCSIFIELSKVIINNKSYKNDVIATMLYVLKNILIFLHPFCPFVTEEIYQRLPKHKVSILKEQWPEKLTNLPRENQVETLIMIINAIRRNRFSNSIANNQKLEINLLTKKNIKQLESNKNFLNQYLIIVNTEIKNVSSVSIVGNKITEVIKNFTIEIPYIKNVNDEIDKIEKLIFKLKNEIVRSDSILKNSNFITKASKSKVDEEKNKLREYEDQLKNAEESLDNLCKVQNNNENH